MSLSVIQERTALSRVGPNGSCHVYMHGRRIQKSQSNLGCHDACSWCLMVPNFVFLFELCCDNEGSEVIKSIPHDLQIA